MMVKVFVSKECRYVSFICFRKQYQLHPSFFVQLFGVSISEKKVKQININVLQSYLQYTKKYWPGMNEVWKKELFSIHIVQ